MPVIEFNGAFLSDLQTGHHEVINAIEPVIAREIHASILAMGRSPFVSTFNGVSDRLYFREARNGGESYYVANRRQHNDHRLSQTDDWVTVFQEHVVCLTVIGHEEPLRDVEMALMERFGALVELHLFENAYSPGWYWLTIHDWRATKDQALRTLVQAYGLDRHELVVFGDHRNDLKMFRMASHAVAVSNALDEVKCAATHLIGSNEEDSVVEYLRTHYVGGDSIDSSREAVGRDASC